MQDSLDRHCRQVIRAMLRGEVIPLLGAGAALCDRPENGRWELGSGLPSATELSQYLAERFDYPLPDTGDLIRVSEYVDVALGAGPLYGSLRDVFATDYEFNSLHRFLAAFPAHMRAAGGARGHLVIVTTNYDDALERAFDDVDEPYELLVYMSHGPHRGRFVHLQPGGKPKPIRRPNEYTGLSPNTRSVIVKIHGTVDRQDESLDSYVITEDHYIEYLTQTNLSQLVPATVLSRLTRSHFLFLGYRLRDWNLRVILHRLWAERDLGYRSWAVQRDRDEIDAGLWDRRSVDLYQVGLDHYVQELESQLARTSPTALGSA
jgi:SIR2-like domain